MYALRLSLLLTFLLCAAAAPAADEVVIADFESDSYGDWLAKGEAFGSAPAAGTLPNQMDVSGFAGQRYASSFHGGDDSTGTLSSPPFRIVRPHLNFLVGGGGFPGETAVNLVVDGETVRTATGPNVEPGGSEALEWQSWDVAEFIGREASIHIVDARTGSWGHITADQFVQSDAVRSVGPAERTIAVEGRYLHLPVKRGAPKVWVELLEDDRMVRRFQIELAREEADFVAAADVGPWQGSTLRIVADKVEDGGELLEQITSSDDLPHADAIYDEPERPAFHFTSKIGWLNDPNGLVYHNGTWHLFYQHNPFGWDWGNMHWGHATSADLIHWSEQGDKIFPWSDCVGAAFSGSGLVDHHNSSGLRRGDSDLLVFAFTDTGAGESLAYSNDGGQTLQMYEGNPVLKHRGRDPKIIWHEPTRRWVMVVYSEVDDQQVIAFHSSPDLKSWTFESRLDGFYECPDLFELPVSDVAGESRWVLYAADGLYILGDFDGHAFQPREDKKHQLWYGDFYAAQTYSDAPEGRRVQIGWGRGVAFPQSRFNQQMVIPVDLRLQNTPDGVRMFAEPVRELDAYRHLIAETEKVVLATEPVELATASAPLDIDVELDLGDCERVELDIAGEAIIADRTAGRLKFGDVAAPMQFDQDRLKLRILVDRGSIEIFAQEGQVAISRGRLFGRTPVTVRAAAFGGDAVLHRASVHEINADRN